MGIDYPGNPQPFSQLQVAKLQAMAERAQVRDVFGDVASSVLNNALSRKTSPPQHALPWRRPPPQFGFG